MLILSAMMCTLPWKQPWQKHLEGWQDIWAAFILKRQQRRKQRKESCPGPDKIRIFSSRPGKVDMSSVDFCHPDVTPDMSSAWHLFGYPVA